MSVGVGSERRTQRSLSRLERGIERAVELSGDRERLAAMDADVSGWSVGRHLEHLWLAEGGIFRWIGRALDDLDASPGAGSPSPTGMTVLITGWIPRGRASAPEPTVPSNIVGVDLTERLSELRDLAGRFDSRVWEIHRNDATLEHPILGHFTPAQWLRFLDVHHRHHEKIIRDIV